MKVFCAESSDGIGPKLAELLETESNAAIKRHGKFNVAFSGGSLPKIVTKGLVNKKLEFDKWNVFYADERCVTLSHEDSNHKSVYDLFISQVHPTPKYFSLNEKIIGDVAACAKDYQKTLEQSLPLSEKKGTGHKFDVAGVPVFDMILLGMGPDGHTCSLFPDHPLLKEHSKFVAPITNSPKPPPNRITLTFPVLYQANSIVFVAAGGSKKEVFPYVIGQKKTEGPDEKYPSRMVENKNSVTWFIDKDAAANLEKSVYHKI